MKTALVITCAIMGMTFVAPVAAHHNCAAGDVCPDEIGDMMGNHEDAIANLDGMVSGDVMMEMDPVDNLDATWTGIDPNQDGNLMGGAMAPDD